MLEDLDVNPARAHGGAVGGWRQNCHKQGPDFAELLREQRNPKLPLLGRCTPRAGRTNHDTVCGCSKERNQQKDRLKSTYLPFAVLKSICTATDKGLKMVCMPSMYTCHAG